ncbi:MAG TPA: hypothetical protein VEW42_01705 [Candidatus Eisenbacteria bacterium]|nr:hypothetical protein [Candidatus Eisenbacteria bacterium]
MAEGIRKVSVSDTRTVYSWRPEPAARPATKKSSTVPTVLKDANGIFRTYKAIMRDDSSGQPVVDHYEEVQ